MLTKEIDKLKEKLVSGQFDFLDFGCGNGGSLRFGKDVLNGKRGLGLDIDKNKVMSAIKAGYDVLHFDVTKLIQVPNCLRFVIMHHFLEHLSGYRDASKCIKAACVAAREFVYIRQPWFDSDGYLFQKGLKFYWSHWKGHSYAMTSLDLYKILIDIPEAKRFCIYGHNRITNSMHSALHPIESPIDQHGWNEHQHPPKFYIEFDQPVFTELLCLIQVNDFINFEAILNKAKFDGVMLFSSAK